VRNVGSADFDDVGLREAIDAGYVPRAARGHGRGDRRDRRPLRLHLLPAVDGRRKAPTTSTAPTRRGRSSELLKKYGAQVIKICATGGVFSRGDEPGQQQLTWKRCTLWPTRRTWPA
jgi:imidazolonepropionase-like amidohydrolase